MASESDKLLVQDIRKGDTDAWQRLIDRYEGRLLAFARRRLSDRSQAEDIVQEAFVGFLNSLPNFDEQRDLQSHPAYQGRRNRRAVSLGWSGT